MRVASAEGIAELIASDAPLTWGVQRCDGTHSALFPTFGMLTSFFVACVECRELLLLSCNRHWVCTVQASCEWYEQANGQAAALNAAGVMSDDQRLGQRQDVDQPRNRLAQDQQCKWPHRSSGSGMASLARLPFRHLVRWPVSQSMSAMPDRLRVL